MHLIAAAGFGWIGWLLTPANWPVVAAVVGGLGFVIFVHELGHFLVAKACGVKCEKFYLGFDPYGLRFFRYQWGETEYGIGLIPIGGYVKMLGQDDNPQNMADEMDRSKQGADSTAARGVADTAQVPHGDIPAEPSAEHPTAHDPRSYLAKSVPQRMAIISAGVVMNLIFAYLMAWLAYGLGVEEIACVVGGTVPGATSWIEGIPAGTQFLEVAGKQSRVFADLKMNVTLSKAEHGLDAKVQVPGENEPRSVVFHPRSENKSTPTIGVTMAHKLDLIPSDPVRKHSAAARAKPEFKGGDKILAVDGKEVKSEVDFDAAMIRGASQTVTLTVERVVEEKNEKRKEQLSIELPPQPRRELGIVATLGPVVAIQRGSPAEKAGVKVGEQIVSIDGQPVDDPLTLAERLRRRAGETIQLTLQSGDKPASADSARTVSVELRQADWEDPIFDRTPLSAPTLGIACRVSPQVVDVLPDSPAAAAGIKPGETIAKAALLLPEEPTDEQRNSYRKRTFWLEGAQEKPASGSFFDWLASLFRKDDPIMSYNVFGHSWLQYNVPPDYRVELQVRSGDKLRTVVVSPRDSSEWFNAERGIAFMPITVIEKATSFADAVHLGTAKATESVFLVYRVLQRLGQGLIPITSVGGPIAIFEQAGYAAKEGPSMFLLFCTMLSANLAVINFLPIPVLDGGHMVFLALEGIRRRPVSEQVMIRFQYAGLLFLLVLMVGVTAMDLSKLFGG